VIIEGGQKVRVGETVQTSPATTASQTAAATQPTAVKEG
jgi:hypothetical protein